MTAVVLVHHDDYVHWVFDSHHPTQGRRFTKARELLLELADETGIDVIEIDSALLPGRAVLETVHDPAYVDEVIVQGRSGEWTDERPHAQYCFPDLQRLTWEPSGSTRR